MPHKRRVKDFSLFGLVMSGTQALPYATWFETNQHNQSRKNYHSCFILFKHLTSIRLVKTVITYSLVIIANFLPCLYRTVVMRLYFPVMRVAGNSLCHKILLNSGITILTVTEKSCGLCSLDLKDSADRANGF